MIDFTCPSCHEELEVEYAGRSHCVCPSCRAMVPLPDLPEALPAPRYRSRTALWVTVWACGLLALAGAAGLLAWRSGWVGGPAGRPGRPVPRAQFEAAVFGLTPGEVRQKVGDPDEVMVDPGGIPDYRYLGRTLDPKTGQPDRSVTVFFIQDRAADVHYDP